MSIRPQTTIIILVEGVGEFQLELDEDTMTFCLSGPPTVPIPDELNGWDACEPDQLVCARQVIECLYGRQKSKTEALSADIDRVHGLLLVLLRTALPEHGESS